MKKRNQLKITLLLLPCLLLACCGKQQIDNDTWSGIHAGTEDLSAITERTEYYDIVAKSETIFEREPEEDPWSMSGPNFVGMQFYQGEPVQLWTEPVLDEYGFPLSENLCLYRPDGSREVVLQGISVSVGHGCHCYLDQEGSCYYWTDSTILIHEDKKKEFVKASLTKILASGEVLFKKEYTYGLDIEDLCQTPDGSIYLIVLDKTKDATGTRELARLDPSTGLISESGNFSLAGPAFGSQSLGTGEGEETPLTFQFHAISGNLITAVDMQKQAETVLLSFTGTSYRPPDKADLCDFRMPEDGTAELLWRAYDGGRSILERLRMSKVEKTPIVLRGDSVSLFAPQAASFNQSSEDYHVVLEDCGMENDREDFARLTSVQIAAGKGPDILYGSLMKDYIYGMMEKGTLEDLSPYMEKSGIREEEYFPFAFDTLRNGSSIYGISPTSPFLTACRMDSDILGGNEEPDIETLTDALLAWQENSAFLAGSDSGSLLELLLAGSDTLWGMVDWEKGSCDFSGELFAKILETAKRYGDHAGRTPDSYIAEYRDMGDVFFFDSLAERERDGKVVCGVLFDDGCHAATSPTTLLSINANSANKEGAWEFLRYLLSEEAQSSGLSMPVSRKAFEERLEKNREMVADGKEVLISLSEVTVSGGYSDNGIVRFTEADLTEEKIAEYIRTLEEARPYPVRTAPILTIIREEAAAYFSGSKSAGQVAETTANRVQLYLDETQ